MVSRLEKKMNLNYWLANRKQTFCTKNTYWKNTLGFTLKITNNFKTLRYSLMVSCHTIVMPKPWYIPSRKSVWQHWAESQERWGPSWQPKTSPTTRSSKGPSDAADAQLSGLTPGAGFGDDTRTQTLSILQATFSTSFSYSSQGSSGYENWNSQGI